MSSSRTCVAVTSPLPPSLTARSPCSAFRFEIPARKESSRHSVARWERRRAYADSLESACRPRFFVAPGAGGSVLRVLDRWANVQWQLLAPRESALTGTRIPYSNPREGVTDGAVPYQRRPAVVTQRQVRSSFLRVDRLYGRRRQRAATGGGHARRSYRRRTAGESQTAEALRAEQGRGVGDKAGGTIHHRQHPLAPFLPERVRGWGVHARRRLRDPRQQLQHDRRSWQLHAQRVQAD